MLLRIYCYAQGKVKVYVLSCDVRLFDLLKLVLAPLRNKIKQIFPPTDQHKVLHRLSLEGITVLGTVAGTTTAGSTGDLKPAPSNEANPAAAPPPPPSPAINAQQQVSVDFEIEPEAYRAIEGLVKSVDAGKNAEHTYTEECLSEQC